MASTKILNLLAISSLAILACSFGARPANALSIEFPQHFARHAGHAVVAKKRRDTSSKRCKPRPATTSPSSTPAAAAPATTATSTTQAAAPASTTQSSNTGSSGGSTGVTSNDSGGNAGSNGGNSKVGIAWPNGDDPALANFKTAKVGPIYTWSPFIPTNARSLGFDPIPMLWGENQIPDFKRLVVKGYAATVLAFNEPNQDGQATMSPQRGAELWKQYIDPLRWQGYSLITPATTSAPSGKTWMTDFFAACTGCHFDGLALHWYGTSSQEFISYVTDFHDTFNLPIWPTEFACQNFAGGAQCSRDEVFSFMSTVTKFMDSTDWIPHYFAFGVMHDMVGVNPDNQLMASNGQPTDLGWMYIQ